MTEHRGTKAKYNLAAQVMHSSYIPRKMNYPDFSFIVNDCLGTVLKTLWIVNINYTQSLFTMLLTGATGYAGFSSNALRCSNIYSHIL